MIKHVWFDMGGTLYRETQEFNLVHDKLRYETFAEVVGLDNPSEAKHQYDELYARHGSNAAVFASLGKPSDFWHTTLEDMPFDRLLAPDTAITDTLQKLSKILPISLFTNFMPVQITNTLQLLEIPESIFTNILSGDDVAKRKPNLEGFNKMIKLSNLPAHQLLYVGDRVGADIKPAKAAGMKTCLLYQQSDVPDYVAIEFPDLLEIIEQA